MGMKRSERLASTMERQKTRARTDTLPSCARDFNGTSGVIPTLAAVNAMTEHVLMWQSVSKIGNLRGSCLR